MSLRNFIRLNASAVFLLNIIALLSSTLSIFSERESILLSATYGVIITSMLVKNRFRKEILLFSGLTLLSIFIHFATVNEVLININLFLFSFLIFLITSSFLLAYKNENLAIKLFSNIPFYIILTDILDIRDILGFIVFLFIVYSIPIINMLDIIKKEREEKIKENKIINNFTKFYTLVLSVFLLYLFILWGRNGILNEGRIFTLLSLSILIFSILIVRKGNFKVRNIGSVALTIGVVIGLLPSSNGLSVDSKNKVSEIALSKSRKVMMDNYRLPGVGYKESLRGKTFNECDQSSTLGRDCFITIYVDLAKEKGIPYALKDAIDAINTTRGQHFASHCHQVTHAIGQLAGATEFKDNPVEGLDLEPQVCATGYTHGIFEAYWKPYDNEKLKEVAPHACSDLKMVEGFYRWTCNHILGHILVQRDELNPGPQLRSCLKIPDEHSANDCLSGGWMQFFSDDPILAMFKSKNATYKEIFKYCNDEPTQSQRMCYQETFPSLSIIKNSNFASEMNDCKSASDETNMKWCLQGVARAIAITGGYTTEFAKKECAKTEEGMVRDYCYTASAASITLNMGSAFEPNRMCDLVMDKETQAYCRRWVRDSRKLIASGPNSQNMPKE